jgi:hypothetical protein
MQTVGYGDWNIDIVRSGNVLAEVADRMAHLDRLPAIRKAAGARWAALKQAQDSAMRRFADAVRAFSQAARPPLPEAPRT